jgi:myo-inositol-1(or 4)-monophosphatase
MTGPDPAGLAELACETATAAGRLLLSRGGRPEVVATKSSPTDVVTDADQAAEELIRQRIGAVRPGDLILGEEGGEVRAGRVTPSAGPGRVRWIVDPLDGTVNYLYGLTDWAVSIAAEVDGTVVAGAVFVPRRDELFSASAGAGARRSSDGRGPVRLACNTGVPLEAALVATGFGYAAGQRLVQAEVLRAVLPRVRDIRRGGSCAVDLCSVASGTVDAYYESGVNLWDFAAGALIAAEAGAQVAGLYASAPGPSMTVAAAPGLLRELRDLLATADPERHA